MAEKWVAQVILENETINCDPVNALTKAFNMLLISAENGGFNANGARVYTAASWMEDRTMIRLEGYGTVEPPPLIAGQSRVVNEPC